MYPLFNKHDGQCFFDQRQLIDRFHWLNEPDKLPIELHCTQLIHFTENSGAESIGFDDQNKFCFKAANWEPFDENHSFLWWSAFPGDQWSDMLPLNYISKNNPKYFKYNFGKSPALDGDSLCGPIGFVVPWKNAIEQYAQNRGKLLSQIQLKVFGTFVYKREIMFSILVCSEGDIIQYKDNGNECELDLLENETAAFRLQNYGESFVWKVHSTTKGWAPYRPHGCPKENWDYPCGTWDHLTFAFYFPGKKQIMKIPPHLCTIKTKIATPHYPDSRKQNVKRKEIQMTPNNELVYFLNEKISRK